MAGKNFILNPGDSKYVLTNYRLRTFEKFGSERTHLWFDLFIFQRPGESEKRYSIRIRNNCSWRNSKGILVWRTAPSSPKGSPKVYYNTEINVPLYEDILKYIDLHWGTKIKNIKLAPVKRQTGFATVGDAMKFLEDSEIVNE